MKEYQIDVTNLDLMRKDYKHSTVELLWLFEENKRILLFGLIKAYPNEFSEQEEITERSFLVNRKTKKRLFYKKISLPFKDSLNYYEQAVKNKPLSILKNNTPACFENKYSNAVAWPYFTVSKDLPFSSSYSAVRFHSLFDINAQGIFLDLIGFPKNLEWIKSNILFDIEKYREFMGSISLLAYNPLYRYIHRKALRNTSFGSEVEYVEFEPRKGVNLNGLKIVFSNNNSLGFFYQKEIILEENGFFLIYPDEIDCSGYAIFCPERGLIDYSEFVGFIKSLSLTINVMSGDTKISYFTKNTPLQQDSYTVPITSIIASQVTSKESNSQIRKDVDITRQMLRSSELERKEREDREQSGQQIIYNNDKEVSNFIRTLIRTAKKRIIFIDPYLSTNEIFKFLLALSNKAVTLTAITSATFLKTKTRWKQNGSLKEKDILNKNIESCKKNIPKFNVLVMTGKNPIFHDRFLVIDNVVWALGTSLNGLEEHRISLLVKVSSPQKIITLIEEQMRNMPRFEEWING